MAVANGELADGAQRLAARLDLLAREAELKREFLIQGEGSSELRQFLADERFLLGLDYLAVTGVDNITRRSEGPLLRLCLIDWEESVHGRCAQQHR